jgi:hypothetical protein
VDLRRAPPRPSQRSRPRRRLCAAELSDSSTPALPKSFCFTALPSFCVSFLLSFCVLFAFRSEACRVTDRTSGMDNVHRGAIDRRASSGRESHPQDENQSLRARVAAGSTRETIQRLTLRLQHRTRTQDREAPDCIVQGDADPLGRGIASTAEPIPTTRCCRRQHQGSLGLLGVIDIAV